MYVNARCAALKFITAFFNRERDDLLALRGAVWRVHMQSKETCISHEAPRAVYNCFRLGSGGGQVTIFELAPPITPRSNGGFP